MDDSHKMLHEANIFNSNVQLEEELMNDKELLEYINKRLYGPIYEMKTTSLNFESA